MKVKQKGNRFERAAAAMLRPFFPEVMTSREGAPHMDGKGWDLVNTSPFAVQCKHVERGLDPFKVLDEIETTNEIKILLWKKNRKGTIACLQEKDLLRLLESLQQCGFISS